MYRSVFSVCVWTPNPREVINSRDPALCLAPPIQRSGAGDVTSARLCFALPKDPQDTVICPWKYAGDGEGAGVVLSDMSESHWLCWVSDILQRSGIHA